MKKIKEKIKKSFKADIEQLKETGKMIEKKAPVTTAIIKSVFIIIKWILASVVTILLIWTLFELIIYIAEVPKRAKLEKQQELKRAEIERQQEKYAQAEIAYQKCLDKVANSSTWKSQTDYSLSGKPFKTTREVNKYFNEWINAGRPNYNERKGYWEIAFMIWMIRNHSSFCDEFNPNLIKYFLDIKSREIGISY